MLATACAGALIAGIPLSAAGSQHELDPVVTGLDGPRGVSVTVDGRVIFAEADGSFSQVQLNNKHKTRVTELGQVPQGFIAPAVGAHSLGRTYVLTPEGEPGSGAMTLYRWISKDQDAEAVADISAYQATDPDPDDLEDFPEHSNPYGLEVLPDGDVLVADAAGNDLLKVSPDGDIVTVVRLKPRMVPVPDGLPDDLPFPLPPAGTLMPSEAVATSVTVGADGYYYVGELRGVPGTTGMSQVWRIAPDAVDAVCDPEAPDTGDCQRYADGFTSIVDLAADENGGIYVLELVQEGWLKFELGLADPVGGLFRIPPGGGAPTELVPGQLILPGGVDVGKDATVYVTNPVFGPGSLSAIG